MPEPKTPRHRNPKLKPFDVIIIEWMDAYAEGASNYSSPEESLQASHKMIRRTVGYYVGERDGQLVMATDDDRSKGSPTAVGGSMVVPLALVLRKHLVARPKLSFTK